MDVKPFPAHASWDYAGAVGKTSMDVIHNSIHTFTLSHPLLIHISIDHNYGQRCMKLYSVHSVALGLEAFAELAVVLQEASCLGK